MQLSDWDRACLAGDEGDAAAFAMKILVKMGVIAGAERMIDLASAHIGGCLYHGPAGLDFADRLASTGGFVRVPATLNVSSLDLLHPHLYRGESGTAAAARRLMDLYVAMGCRQTWTCAPYQLPDRPSFGEHVAWAESNAIVFANSVLGARTERYGDFIDICAAITGRVPEVGLHLTSARAATVVYDVGALPSRITESDLFYSVLGHLLGRESGSRIPAIVGMPDGASEDDLKALGAAAASSGSVALFHAVGITPEAPTLADALQGGEVEAVVRVTEDQMLGALHELSGASSDDLHAISVGTPHMSAVELSRVAELFGDRRVDDRVTFYASTGRDVLRDLERDGVAARLEDAGVQIVTDTCTYITPILDSSVRVVMTNSAKWAYYAPGNLGVEVLFASLSTCVESAVAGRIVENDDSWN